MERWFPIKTERLILREFTPDDEADMHEYLGDHMVARFEKWPTRTAEEVHKLLCEWLEQQEQWPRDTVSLGVELVAEHKLIGSMRLWISDPSNRTAGFGYALNQKYWNQGFATEASRALLDRAFNVLGLHRIWADCDSRNIASRRVMEKLGMRREGHFLKDALQKSQWRDSYLYAILSEEWTGER